MWLCEFLDLRRKIRTYLHVQVREETARLSHVRQLLYDYVRAGKAWKAPRTRNLPRQIIQTSYRWMLIPCTVKVAKGRKARVQVKTKVTDPDTTAKAKVNSQSNSDYFDGYCNQCGEYGHKKPDCAGKNKFFNGTCNKCGAHGHKQIDCPVKTVAHLESVSVIEPNEEPAGIECTTCSSCAVSTDTVTDTKLFCLSLCCLACLGLQIRLAVTVLQPSQSLGPTTPAPTTRMRRLSNPDRPKTVPCISRNCRCTN